MAHDREKGGKEAYSIVFDKLAIDELAELDAFWRDQIRDIIKSRLFTKPELFGKPLRRTLKGCWSLRVGDYRTVYRIEGRIVRILAVIHRSSDYRGVDKRI